MTEENADNEERRGRAPRLHEIALFALFGLLPIGALYLVARGGLDDQRGRAFEDERRLVLSACMEALHDREECLEQVDDRFMACHTPMADEHGAIDDRQALLTCLSTDRDGTFRMRSAQEKRRDAEARKQQRR